MIVIIPAIDLIDGKCVRLERGRFDTAREYAADPVDLARQFEQQGLTRLHLVDLDGVRQGRVINWPTLEKIAGSTGLVIDFSGGIRSRSDLEMVFDSGATLAAVGSMAVTDKLLFSQWLLEFGREKIILAADYFGDRLRINAWQKDTDVDLLDFIKAYQRMGVRNVICTDIAKDGLLQGPALEMYGRIKASIPDIYLVASGGIGGLDHIRSLDRRGVDAVIVGKALYEGKIKLQELDEFLC